MTTYITLAGAYQYKNIDLHGYILSGKRELIAQNQALERVNRGKFRLARGNTDYIRDELVTLLEGISINLDPKSQSFRELAREYLKQYVRAQSAWRAFENGLAGSRVRGLRGAD
jgi:hypothetical protein